MIKKYTSQFWVGTFDSSEQFYDFVGEDPEYCSNENEEHENIPLSKFIESQGEKWFDHDFIEAGYNNEDISILKKFREYSYSDQWADPVTKKMASLGINNINAFIMMGVDEQPNGTKYLQVSNPQSYESEVINLIYIGEFDYHHDFSWMDK